LEALPEAQLLYHRGGVDVAGVGCVANPSRELNSGSEEIALFRHGLPCAHPDTHTRTGTLELREPVLQSDGALNGLGHGAKGGHDPVPGVLDLLTVARLERRADGVVV